MLSMKAGLVLTTINPPNRAIVEGLCSLSLSPKIEDTFNNLRICYQFMINMGYIGIEEKELLEAWILDMGQIKSASTSL